MRALKILPGAPSTVEGSGGPIGVQQVTAIEIGHDRGTALKNDLHNAISLCP